MELLLDRKGSRREVGGSLDGGERGGGCRDGKDREGHTWRKGEGRHRGSGVRTRLGVGIVGGEKQKERDKEMDTEKGREARGDRKRDTERQREGREDRAGGGGGGTETGI